MRDLFAGRRGATFGPSGFVNIVLWPSSFVNLIPLSLKVFSMLCPDAMLYRFECVAGLLTFLEDVVSRCSGRGYGAFARKNEKFQLAVAEISVSTHGICEGWIWHKWLSPVAVIHSDLEEFHGTL
jgi:hypothetical protein